MLGYPCNNGEIRRKQTIGDNMGINKASISKLLESISESKKVLQDEKKVPKRFDMKFVFDSDNEDIDDDDEEDEEDEDVAKPEDSKQIKLFGEQEESCDCQKKAQKKKRNVTVAALGKKQ